MSITVGDARPQADSPPLPPLAQRVLDLLQGRAVDGVAYVPVAELAELADVSERTIQRATAVLREAGLLDVPAPRGRGVPNGYRPAAPAVDETP